MNTQMTGVAAVVDAAVSVVLIDLNNVRGELGFPSLHATLAAASLWADKCASETLVVVAVDHGHSALAYELSDCVVVAFAGPHSDADTVLVHTVDWLLSGDHNKSVAEVTVVTSDRMLLRRCRFGLPQPVGNASWYERHGLQPPNNPEFDARGKRRPDAQRGRLIFQASADLAQVLSAYMRHGSGASNVPTEEEGLDEKLTWNEWMQRTVVQWLGGAQSSHGAHVPGEESLTYRTRRGKGGKILAKPKMVKRWHRSCRRENSADRVRMAAQLQEQLSENLSEVRCVVSRGGAPDGANPEAKSSQVKSEAHALLVSSMAALFIEWFASDRRLHRCTRPQPLAAALGTNLAARPAKGSDKRSGSGGGRRSGSGGGSLMMLSGVLLPLLLGMLLLGLAFV
jgi:hypothetical protein